MMDIHAITTVLLKENSTVALVGQHLGELGARHGSEYPVTTHDTMVSSASIGSRGDLNSAPQYVELAFRATSNVTTAMLASICPEWKEMPTNPGANPFHYACKATGSNGVVDVMLYADLTGELHEPTSHLAKLLIQRNVWR